MIDKDLLNYIKGKRYYLVLITLFSFLGLASSVSSTFLLSKSVETYINSDYKLGTIYLLICLGLIALFVTFFILKGKLSNKLAEYVSLKIRGDIYEKYVSLNGSSSLKVQEIAQLSSEGIEQLKLYYSSYLPSFFYSMSAPIALFILFCFFSWKVAILYLACVPLIPVSIIVVSKWAKKIFATYWNKYLSLGGAYLDSIKGMKELLIFNYDKKMEEEMKSNSEEFRRITMKVLVMQLCSTTIMDFVAYGGAAIGIVLSLLALNNGEITYQVAIFLILVGAEFFLPLRALGSAFHIAMNGATAGKKVISLLKEEELKDGEKGIKSISSIILNDVSFKYKDGDSFVFKNINMKINKGFTSLLGDSGSGKSTLSKILSKQISDYEGSIKVDNEELSSLKIYDYRKLVCYLSIDTYLLHLSIKDAFHFYNPDIKENEMIELLEKVSLKERILDEYSLDFIPKEDAIDLSGGEKQRLILAYYLGTKKDFYIFDETTSNIDKDSEEIILSAISSLAKDKVVLFISHRVKNALNANYVYLLGKDGTLKEEGKPEELLKKESSFKSLVENENKWEELA